MPFPYLIICLAFAVFACVALAVAAWPRRDDPIVKAFLVLTLGAAFWCGGRTMEVSSLDLADRILWAKLQYVSIMVVPVAWLFAMVRLTRPDLHLSRACLAVPVAVTLFVLALVATNELHGLIWRSVTAIGDPRLPRAHFVHGAAFPLVVGYSYAMLLASLYFLLTARTRHGPLNRRVSRLGRATLIAGLCLPFIAHVAYLKGWTRPLGGDLTPATFSVMALLIWICALRPHLNEVGHYARLRVFDALQEGCVIVDDKHVVVDLNRAARRLLPELAIGEPAPESWREARPEPPSDASYELTAETVRNLVDKALGRIVFLRDVSGYRNREHALVQENSSLAVRLSETVEKLSRIESDLHHDPMTGLFNRRWFEREIASGNGDAFVRGERIGLLLIDVDHFKQFNDLYGHVMGDDCLRMVARAIASAVGNPRGFSARIGGEEFAIVLPRSSRIETRATGVRVLQAVRGLGIAHAGAAPANPFVTVSVGAICEIPAMQAYESLMVNADAAMYAAKRAGRNQFMMSGSKFSAIE